MYNLKNFDVGITVKSWQDKVSLEKKMANILSKIFFMVHKNHSNSMSVKSFWFHSKEHNIKFLKMYQLINFDVGITVKSWQDKVSLEKKKGEYFFENIFHGS